MVGVTRSFGINGAIKRNNREITQQMVAIGDVWKLVRCAFQLLLGLKTRYTRPAPISAGYVVRKA